jgi:hypothetical protein
MNEWYPIILLGIVVSPLLFFVLFLLGFIFVGIVSFFAEMYFKFCRDVFRMTKDIVRGEKDETD